MATSRKPADHDLLIELNTKVDIIHKEMKEFVTRAEFTPVKAIVYGVAGLLLTGVFGALLAFVLKKP